MSAIKPKKLTVGDKGRITLGSLAKGVDSFQVIQHVNGSITLIPFTDVPSSEVWLHRNKTAQTRIKIGLTESAAGEAQSSPEIDAWLEESDD